MASVDKLAKGLDWSGIFKMKDLKSRILFTLFVLVLYRIGTYIPVAGIDPAAVKQLFASNSNNMFGIFDVLSGGALRRMSIFSLNVIPYISASIIVQLLTSVFPYFTALKKEGEVGRKKLNQYSRVLTLFLAVLQGFGVATLLENMTAGSGVSLALHQGAFFKVSVMIEVLGGTMFLMWLGEQITKRGIGNGVSLIIFSGIVANLPRALATTLNLSEAGSISPAMLILLIFMILIALYIIVFVERSQRRITIQYPRQQVNNRVYGGNTSYFPLKVNSSGVIPPIFASSLLMLPITILGVMDRSNASTWLRSATTFLQRGHLGYMILYSLLIIFFVFFYTPIVLNTKEIAENFQNQGSFIPGIKPGTHTANFLSYILTRLSVIGAIYLVLVCLLPEFLIYKYAVPFYFGGTSLLIVVNVALDTFSQLQNYLFSYQYDKLLNKNNFNRKRRKI